MSLLFHTSYLLLDLSVGLGLGQCENTVRSIKSGTELQRMALKNTLLCADRDSSPYLLFMRPEFLASSLCGSRGVEVWRQRAINLIYFLFYRMLHNSFGSPGKELTKSTVVWVNPLFSSFTRSFVFSEILSNS